MAFVYRKFEHSLEINEIFPPFVNTNNLTTMHLAYVFRIIKLLANIFVKTKASSDWYVLLLQEENSKNGKVSVGSLKTRLCTASLSQTGNVTQKYSFMLTFPDDLFFLLSFPTTVFFFGSGYGEQKNQNNKYSLRLKKKLNPSLSFGLSSSGTPPTDRINRYAAV